jgi:hypothetical protein
MRVKMKVTVELLFALVRELGDKIRAVGLSPVELTEAYLDRLAKSGPKLNAVITIPISKAVRRLLRPATSWDSPPSRCPTVSARTICPQAYNLRVGFGARRLF